MNGNIVLVFNILLISIICADDINIGFIHDGSADQFYDDFFNKLATESSVTITYKYYQVLSDLSDIDAVINKIVEDKVLHVFADELLFSVTEKFNHKPFFVWMSYPFAQESCTKNVIYFNAQVVIADSKNPFIPVVIIEDDYSRSKNNFSDKILGNLKFPGFNEFHIVTHDHLKNGPMDFYIDNAIYILCNRDEDLIKKFYASSDFINKPSPVYSLVNFNLGDFTADFLKVKTSTKITTTFLNDDPNYDAIKAAVTTNSHKYTYTDYGYYILFNLLVKGYNNAGTLSPIGLTNSLYGKEYTFGNNKVILVEHNYASCSYYMTDFVDKTTDSNADVDLQILHKYPPHDYFDPTETLGGCPLVHCSWQSNPITGKTSAKSVIMLFLNPNSGSAGQNAQFLSNFQVAVVEYLNRNNGFMGKHVRAYVINSDIPSFALIPQVEYYYKTYEVAVIFVAAFDDSMAELYKYVDEHKWNIIFIITTQSNSDKCISDRFEFGLSTNVISETILNYITKYNIPDVFIVGTNESFSTALIQTLEYRLKEFEVRIISNAIMSDLNEEEGGVIAKSIKKAFPDGGIVINTASSAYNKYFFKALFNENITYEDGYEIYNVFLTEKDVQTYGIDTNLTGLFSIGYYFNVENASVMNEIREYLYDDGVYTSDAAVALNSLKLVAQAFTQAGAYDKATIKQFLYSQSVTTPSIYSMEFSGYTRMSAKIYQLDNTHTFVPIYIPQFTVNPDIYYPTNNVCSWKEYKNTGIQKYNLIVFGSMYDHSNKDHYVYVEQLINTIDAANSFEVVQNTVIRLYHFRHLNDDDKYDNYEKNIIMMKSNDYSGSNPVFYGIFGGYDAEEIERITPLLTKYNLLLFDLHPHYGESCNDHILHVGGTFNQFGESPLIYGFQNSDYLEIISDDLINNVNISSTGYKMLRQFTTQNVKLSKVTDFSNFTLTNEYLNSIKENYQKPSVFIFMNQQHSELFVQNCYNKTENMKLYVFDVWDKTIEKNPAMWDKVFVFSTYLGSSNYSVNLQYRGLVDRKMGKAYDFATPYAVNVFDVLQFFRNLDSIQQYDTSKLLSLFYGYTIVSLVGEENLGYNNYLTKPVFVTQIMKFEENDNWYHELVYGSDGSTQAIPYATYMNDNKYYECNFIDSNILEKKEITSFPIGILLDLSKASDSFGLYGMLISEVETINSEGGIRGLEIVTVVRSCPTGDASDLFMELKADDVVYVFSICSEESLKQMKDPISLLNMILFHAGRNYGNECSSNILMLATSPSQEIMPGFYYLLHKYGLVNLVLVEKVDEYRMTRIQLIDSVLKMLPYESITYFSWSDDNDRDQVLKDASSSLQQYKDTCLTVLVMDQYDMEDYYIQYHNVITDADKELFPVVAYTELSGELRNPSYMEGQYVFTSYTADVDTKEVKDFVNVVGNKNEKSIIPYSIVLTWNAFILLTITLKSYVSYDSAPAIVLNAIKMPSFTGITGYTAFDSTNHLKQQMIIGQIKDGIIKLDTVVSKSWPSQPFQGDYYDDTVFVCNAGQKVEVETFNVGVFVSYIEQSIDEALQLLEISFIAVSSMNNLNGKMMNIFVCDVHNDMEKGKECFKKGLERKIVALVGTTSSEEIALFGPLCDENEITYYVPFLSEGEYCFRNTLFISPPISAYNAIYSSINKNLDGDIVIVMSDTKKSQTIGGNIAFELDFRGLNVIRQHTIPYTKTDLAPISNSVKMELPNGGIILNLLESSHASEFIAVLSSNNVVYPTYRIVSFFADVGVAASSEYGSYFENQLIWNTYNPYTVEDETQYTEWYGLTFTYRYTYSSLATNVYTSLFTIGRMYEALGGADPFTTRIVCYDNEILTPLGTYLLSDTNVFKVPIFLSQVVVNENGEYTVNNWYYPVLDSATPEVITFNPVEYKTCKWNEFAGQSGQESYQYLDIGLLLSSTGNDYKNDRVLIEMIIGYFKHVNTMYDIKGYKLRTMFSDIKSNSTYALEQLKLLQSQGIIFFVGCSNNECKNTIMNYVSKNSTLAFFYAGPTSGEECYGNSYFTGKLPNQYITQTIQYIAKSELPHNIIIVGTNKSSYSLKLAMTTVQTAYGILGLKGVHLLNTLSTYSSFIYEIPNKCGDDDCSIVLVTDIYETIQFVSDYHISSISQTKYPLFVFTINTMNKDYFGDNFRNIYIPTMYSIKAQPYYTENTKVKDMIFHYTSYEPGDSLVQMYFVAQLIAEGLYYAPTLTSKDLSMLLQNVRFQGPLGYTTISESHYLSHPFILVKINDKGEEELIDYFLDPITPQPYDWMDSSMLGKQCQFGQGGVTSIVVEEVVTLTSIIDTNGDNSDLNRGVSEAINAVVDAFNANGGIDGRTIVHYLKNTDNAKDAVTYIEMIRDSLNSQSQDAAKMTPLVFLSINDEVRDNVFKSVSDINGLLIDASMSNPNFCENNVIVAGLTIGYYDRLLDIILHRQYPGFAIISELDNVASSYVKKYLERKGGDVLMVYYNESTVDVIIISSLLHTLKSQFSEGCLIFLGKSKYHALLNAGMINTELYEPKYHLISFTSGGEIIDSIENILSFEAAGAYSETIDRDENREFIERMKAYYTGTTYLSDRIARSYSILNILFDAMIKADTITDFTKVREMMYQTKYNAPEGVLTLSKNNYLTRVMTLTEFDSATSQFSLVYSTDTAIEGSAWISEGKIELFTCDFLDLAIGKKKKEKTISVVVPVALTGKDAKEELKMLDSILLAIDEINENGGILDNKVVADIRDTNSDEAEFLSIVETVKDSDSKLIIGGIKSEVYSNVGPRIEKILYFFPGYNPGEMCFENALSVNYMLDQLKIPLELYLYETMKTIFIVYDGSEIGMQCKLMVGQIIGESHLNSNGQALLTEENIGITVTLMKSKLLNGGTIVNCLSTSIMVNFLQAMCDNSLYAPKYTVISLFFQNRYLDDLEGRCVANHYVISSFFPSLANDSLSTIAISTNSINDFTNHLCQRIGWDSKIESYMEASYSSLLLWADAVQKAYTFDADTVRSVIYGRKYNSPSDFIIITSNNVVSRRIYTAYITPEKEMYIVKGPDEVIIPDIYSAVNTKSLSNAVCDWSSSVKQASYEKPHMNVLMVHNSDATDQLSDLYQSLVEKVFIDAINKDGGILGYEIVILDAFYSANSGEMRRKVKDMVINNEIAAMFGCTSIFCIEIMTEIAEDLHMLYFATASEDGSSCSAYTVHVGPSLNQMVVPLFPFLKTVEVNAVFVITYPIGKIVEDINAMSSQFTDIGLTLGGICLYDSNNNVSVDSFQKCSSAIVDLYEIYDRIIVYVNIYSYEVSYFIESLKRNDILMEKIKLILFAYEKYFFSEAELDYMEGNFIINPNGDGTQNTVSLSFNRLIQSNLGSDFPITNTMTFMYTAIQLWKSGVELASKQVNGKWPSTEYVRLTLIGETISVPGGSTTIKSSMYTTQNFYVTELVTREESLVYPTKGVNIETDPILSMKCEFGVGKELYAFDSLLQIVLFSILGVIIVICVYLCYFLWNYRDTNAVKFASPLFLFYMLIALMLLSVEGVVFIFEPTKSNGICELRVWGLTLTIDLVFSIILAKAWRIHRLFNNKELKKITISNMSILKVILATLTIQLIYLGIWWGVDKSEYTETLSDTYSTFFENVFIPECTVNEIFVYIQVGGVAIMLLYGIKLAWSVRKASSEFNESITLASTFLIMFIMGVIDVPLNFILDDSPNALLALRAYGVELGVFIILTIHYFPKVYQAFNTSNAMDTVTLEQSKSTTTATTQRSIHSNNNDSVSESVSIINKPEGRSSKAKRVSLNQRNSQVYLVRFKQNPDHDDLDKVSRATLAAMLALSQDDPNVKED